MITSKKNENISGVLLLDKPSGLTSNAALQRVKRYFRANKAGHTGALDPLATGILPICFGEATKFSSYMLESDKHYLVTARLGLRTDTSDSDGEVIQRRAVSVSQSDIIEKLALFRGKLKQLPTMFSALKYQGYPLYHYARRGLTVPRIPRDIEIYSLELIKFLNNELTLSVHCSKGTYIRTLVDDLGEQLACGAHVIFLRRLQVAHFTIDKVFTFDDFSIHQNNLTALLLPIDSLMQQLPKMVISSQESEHILNGRSIPLPSSISDANRIRIYINEFGKDHFIGIGVCQNSQLLPYRLINHQQFSTC